MGMPVAAVLRQGCDCRHQFLPASRGRAEVFILHLRYRVRLPDLQITGEPEMLRSNFVHGIKRMPFEIRPA